MAEDLELVLRRIQGLAGKIEAAHSEVTEMMRLMVKDGLGAMQYGQFGTSFPDPTPKTVINGNPDPAAPLWARDNVAETDLADYRAGIKAAEKALDYVDFLRRKYTSANMDIRNRLDPTDFCRTHFDLHLYEGHRRVKGDMCSICSKFAEQNGRPPTATECDYYHRHGRWPHKLFDPKARKAV